MTRNTSPVRAGVFALTAASLAGCGWFGSDPMDVLESDDSLLRYVPADTPYLMTVAEPMPDELTAKFEAELGVIWDELRGTLATLIDTELRAGDERGVVENILALLSPESLADSGLSYQSTMVLYGHGLLPVYRAVLAEDHRFEDFLARVESILAASGDVTLTTGAVDGQEYRYIADGEARFVLALIGNELVLTVVPAALDENALGALLGLRLPERSIADTGELRDIAERYELTPHFLALVDSRRIADIFLEEPTGTNAVLLDSMGYDRSVLGDVCWSEIRDVVAVVPRITGGYTELDAERMAGRSVLELREDIAAGLATIPAPIPAASAMSDAFLSFGIGLDIEAALAFLDSRLEAVEADPFECEIFFPLQMGAARARMTLNQPIPPMIYGLRGLSAAFENIPDVEALAAGRMTPADMDFSLAIAADDVAGVLETASMFSPQLANLDLGTDGAAVAVDPRSLAAAGIPIAGPAFVASTESKLVFALGAGAEDSVMRMIAAADGDPSTLFSMHMDLARYYGLLADTLEVQAAGRDATVAGTLGRLFRVYGNLLSREQVDVGFTENGVDIAAVIELGE